MEAFCSFWLANQFQRSSLHHCLEHKLGVNFTFYTLISHGKRGVRWQSEAQGELCGQGSSTVLLQPQWAWFYCPDKTSSWVIVTSSCPFFVPTLQRRCKRPERKITHLNSHTGLSLLLWPKSRFMDTPTTTSTVRCRWVKYYIKASLMFHSTSHISPQYRVQNWRRLHFYSRFNGSMSIITLALA